MRRPKSANQRLTQSRKGAKNSEDASEIVNSIGSGRFTSIFDHEETPLRLSGFA
jgi:hypothetical protein